jgi:apolipoprotein N-acyltransferase
MWEKLYRNKLLLSVLAGASVFVAFPRFYVFPLVIFYPLFTHMMVRRCERLKTAFLLGFLTSFIIMLGGFYWVIYVIHEFGYLPWVVAVLLYVGFCGFGALNFPVYSSAVFFLNRKLN